MKKAILFLLPAFILSVLTGCGLSADNNSDASETSSVSESAETAAEGVPLSSGEKPQKEIKPLTPTKKQSYFQNGDFSVCAELDSLQSSLYYPDIIHDYGANQKLFVLTVKVRVKNISSEDKSFDTKKFSLVSGDTELFLCDDMTEKFTDISSEKSVSESVRFLCSLDQAAAVSGFIYGGEEFDTIEEFIPDDIADTIKTQSAEDLRTYLYREHVMYRDGLHINYEHTLPCFYNMTLSRITADDGYYFAIRFNAYNRSDYAQIIEPSAFRLSCKTADGSTALEDLCPAYICTDEELMYEPKKSEKIDGIKGQPYEMPDFLCMNPTGVTDFTLVYDAGSCSEPYELNIIGTHKDMMCYNYPLENMSFTYSVVKNTAKNTEALHFENILSIVYDDPDTYNKNDPLTDNGEIVLEKPKLKDNQVEYKSDKLTVLFEFTGAENLIYYPLVTKMNEHDEWDSVLHATVTVTNTSNKDMDIIPQNFFIYGERSGCMTVFSETGTELIAATGYYTIKPDETVSFDIDFVGDSEVIDNAKKIRYGDEYHPFYNDVDEKQLKNQCRQFDVTDRLAIQNAVKAAKELTEEELGFPDILLPADDEQMIVTDNYSYCFSVEPISDGKYVRLRLRLKCLTDYPGYFTPIDFRLSTADDESDTPSYWSCDRSLLSREPKLIDVFPEEGELFQAPFEVSVGSDKTAEYTMYFRVDSNNGYVWTDYRIFSYSGKNDSFKEYFTIE